VKVLHIWNPAGVASTLAKYQYRLLNWKTWVITRKYYDKFGLTIYGEAIDCSYFSFKIRALIKALSFDIIHVHAFDEIISLLKKLYPHKKIIIHYHGSDIRGKWKVRKRFWKKADLILVSTPDLLQGAPENAIYLPNPVDTELFKPLPKLREIGTALYLVKHQKGEDLNWPIEVAKKMQLKLTVRDRVKEPIPYGQMPNYLNTFEYYIDRNYIKSLSKTALEALACGCKVVRWDEEIVQGLPDGNRPENVVVKLKQIYEQLLRE